MIQAEFGWSKRADGSCLLEETATDIPAKDLSKVLVTVHGPGPVKSKLELIDRATVQVILCPLNYPPGGESDVWASKLQLILSQSVIAVEETPRSLIQVSIQPLNIGLNFLTVMINGIYLALLDASIPLRRSFVAISSNPERNLVICDPIEGLVLYEECEREWPMITKDQMEKEFLKLKQLVLK